MPAAQDSREKAREASVLRLCCGVLEKMTVLKQQCQNAPERKMLSKSGEGCTSVVGERGNDDSSCFLSACHTQSPSHMASHFS